MRGVRFKLFSWFMLLFCVNLRVSEGLEKANSVDTHNSADNGDDNVPYRSNEDNSILYHKDKDIRQNKVDSTELRFDGQCLPFLLYQKQLT